MLFVALIIALACLIAVWVVVFGVLARPQCSLYAYLALWLIVPKALRLTYLTGGRYDFPEGITVFNVLEAVAALGIVVAMVTHRRTPDRSAEARAVRRLSLLLLVAGVASLLVSLGLFGAFFPSSVLEMSSFLAATVKAQYRILPVLSMLYAAIFVFGCTRFIRSVKQAEPFFWLLALSGVELALERIVFVNLNLFPELQRYAIHDSGRFNSLIFTGYDFVGAFAILSVCASLYLALRGRAIGWVTFALAWIPIIAGYQRAVLLGALAAVVFVLCMLTSGRTLVLLISGFVAVVGTVLVTNWDHSLFNTFGHSLGGRIRTDYFGAENAVERLALWKRSLDVFGFLFPAGTGPNAAQFAMNYPIPDIHSGLSSGLANEIYASLVNGTRTTNPHNVLLEFLADFGALGIALIAAFGLVVGRLFVRRLRADDVSDEAKRRARIAQACAFGMLVGIGVHGLFEATELPYFVYLLPVCVVGICGTTATRPRPVEPPARHSARHHVRRRRVSSYV